MSERSAIALRALQQAFPGIPEDEADVLLTNATIGSYGPGKILTLEDAIEHTFYILLEGEVKVTKKINDQENRLLTYLGAGRFFGEIALIHDEPRSATITTVTDVKTLEIDKKGFEAAFQQSPTMALAMVREVTNRLRSNDQLAIEDLREKARELAEAYQQLAEQDKVRREFLTTIAHELRTPLTSAAGYMQVISSGMMEGEALKSALGTVSRNLSQIVSLTNDILFLQEMDLILSEFEPVSVGKLVASAVDEERKVAEEMGVGVQLNIAPNLPQVPGDSKSLERAFRAIINNAFKFSINGGDVEITVDHNPNFMWVAVKDPGIGIDPEDLEKIFDRFWRTEEFEGRLFPGVGLGLPIARQVIEQHSGEIEVKSKPKSGATFTIRLKKVLDEVEQGKNAVV